MRPPPKLYGTGSQAPAPEVVLACAHGNWELGVPGGDRKPADDRGSVRGRPVYDWRDPVRDRRPVWFLAGRDRRGGLGRRMSRPLGDPAAGTAAGAGQAGPWA